MIDNKKYKKEDLQHTDPSMQQVEVLVDIANELHNIHNALWDLSNSLKK